jgi:hypothetical protein
MADTETLDDLVRRVDPDRWLASRFIADTKARADVIALYAFNYELARVAGGVSNALMGEIRLTWWREAMEEIAAGKTPRKHPNVEAVAAAGSIPWAPWPRWPRPASPTWTTRRRDEAQVAGLCRRHRRRPGRAGRPAPGPEADPTPSRARRGPMAWRACGG